MFSKLTVMERDAVLLHLAFAVICTVVLVLPIGLAVGVRLFALVLLYNVAVPIVGRRYPVAEWFDIWLFAFIISLFQVLPDWFLSAQLGVLMFPDDGLFKIGDVSGYMAGLWTVPFFMIMFIGTRVKSRVSSPVALWSVAAASLLIFVGSEETMWMIPSWSAVNVTKVGHVALYLIIPEIILGLSVYQVFETIRQRNHWVKIPAAFLVMLLYTGGLSIFYFIFEKVLS